MIAALPGAAGSLEALAQTDSTASYSISEVEEGWVPTTVTSTLQSSEGYLWLGTYQGLMRFDGVRFSIFDSGRAPGLRNGRITALIEDRKGQLWIGHETGEVTRMEGNQFTPHTGENHPVAAIEAFVVSRHDDVWAMDSAGVLRRLADGLALQFPGGVPAGRRVAVAQASDQTVWLVANGAVAMLDRDQLVPFTFSQESGTPYYERIAPARQGGMWVIGNGRLRRWFRGEWCQDLGEGPWARGPATALHEIKSGILVIGTLNDGLYLLRSGRDPEHFTRTTGLSHDWVRSVSEDHEGNVWVGTGAGLNVLRPQRVRMLNAPDHFKGRAVLSFAFRSPSEAWVGTEGAGLYRYLNGEWTAFNETNGIANSFVWSTLATRDGGLIAGTWGGGLLRLNGDRFECPPGLTTLLEPILSLLESRTGAIWIGTTAGLFRYENEEVVRVAGVERLAFPNVRAIAEAADDTLWVGLSGGGLARFRNGAWKQFRKQDGLCSDFVQAILIDPDGTVWIGSSDNGLGRLKGDKFATISVGQGLPTTLITHIVDDHAGHLWLGSNRGIVRARKDDLGRCADGALASVECFNYARSEGLTSEMCSGGFQPGACQTAAGALWFPTRRGIAIVDPADIVPNPQPPPVVIENFAVDGHKLELPGYGKDAGVVAAAGLKVSPGKQRFELRYTALSFAAPEKVRFRYKLEGLEKDWTEAGTDRSVQYSHLPAGAYTFRVTACNNDRVWNEAGASLAFVVQPWFWQTSWFGLLVVGGLLGVTAGVVRADTRRRMRRKLEAAERRRAVEYERSRIAQDIHDDLGSHLTRITMLSESAQSDIHAPEKAAADIQRIYTTARELTRAMDEIVWAVNPRHDTLEGLLSYLEKFAQDFLGTAGMRCRLDFPLPIPSCSLTAEARHNLFLAFKEALNNTVKHSQATSVQISLVIKPEAFCLVVADNGKGFDSAGGVIKGDSGPEPGAQQDGAAAGEIDSKPARLGGGDGLENMRRRLRRLEGSCEIQSKPGEGARVTFRVPLHAHPAPHEHSPELRA